MVKVKPGAKVITIETAQNALTIEWAVELFSTAFEQTRALKVVDKLAVNGLTQELTAAEVTTVFRGTSARSSGASGTSTEISSITFRKFSEWLKGKPGQYREWFNYSRFCGGVKTFSAELYECNVRNLT